MARYIVQRRYSDGLLVPVTEEGAGLGGVAKNSGLGVTWIQSYVSEDKTTSFCVYDGPNPEAIRLAAAGAGLPVDAITKVSVLNPYFYR